MMDENPQKVSVMPPDDLPVPTVTPLDMLNRAVLAGADIAMIEKLMALHERWDANQARKAYDNAMAAAKAEIPNISKNREVDFISPKGRTHYRHEDLGEIAKAVNPVLARHGLFYRFRTSSPVNEPITVTCVVSHRDGYFEENTLCAGRDDSGNKNAIQAIGSTVTYLQRMTLKAALGLAASNDDDGKAAGDGEKITAQQAEEIADKCAAVADGFDTSFCNYFGIDQISDLAAKDYQRAIIAIGKKKGTTAK
jgi:hypothetical protein